MLHLMSQKSLRFAEGAITVLAHPVLAAVPVCFFLHFSRLCVFVVSRPLFLFPFGAAGASTTLCVEFVTKNRFGLWLFSSSGGAHNGVSVSVHLYFGWIYEVDFHVLGQCILRVNAQVAETALMSAAHSVFAQMREERRAQRMSKRAPLALVQLTGLREIGRVFVQHHVIAGAELRNGIVCFSRKMGRCSHVGRDFGQTEKAGHRLRGEQIGIWAQVEFAVLQQVVVDGDGVVAVFAHVALVAGVQHGVVLESVALHGGVRTLLAAPLAHTCALENNSVA